MQRKAKGGKKNKEVLLNYESSPENLDKLFDIIKKTKEDIEREKEDFKNTSENIQKAADDIESITLDNIDKSAETAATEAKEEIAKVINKEEIDNIETKEDIEKTPVEETKEEPVVNTEIIEEKKIRGLIENASSLKELEKAILDNNISYGNSDSKGLVSRIEHLSRVKRGDLQIPPAIFGIRKKALELIIERHPDQTEGLKVILGRIVDSEPKQDKVNSEAKENEPEKSQDIEYGRNPKKVIGKATLSGQEVKETGNVIYAGKPEIKIEETTEEELILEQNENVVTPEVEPKELNELENKTIEEAPTVEVVENIEAIKNEKFNEFFEKLTFDDLKDIDALRERFYKEVMSEDVFNEMNLNSSWKDNLQVKYFDNFCLQAEVVMQDHIMTANREGSLKSEGKQLLKSFAGGGLYAGLYKLASLSVSLGTAAAVPLKIGVGAAVGAGASALQYASGKIYQNFDAKSIKGLAKKAEKMKKKGLNERVIFKQLKDDIFSKMQFDKMQSEKLDITSADLTNEEIDIYFEGNNFDEKKAKLEDIKNLLKITQEAIVNKDLKDKDIKKRQELIKTLIENNTLEEFITFQLAQKIEKESAGKKLTEEESTQLALHVEVMVSREMSSLLGDVIAQEKFDEIDEKGKSSYEKSYFAKLFGKTPPENFLEVLAKGAFSGGLASLVYTDAAAGMVYMGSRRFLGSMRQELLKRSESEIKTTKNILEEFNTFKLNKDTFSQAKEMINEARARIKLPNINDIERSKIELKIDALQNKMALEVELGQVELEEVKDAKEVAKKIVEERIKQVAIAVDTIKKEKKRKSIAGLWDAWKSKSSKDKWKIVGISAGRGSLSSAAAALGAGVIDIGTGLASEDNYNVEEGVKQNLEHIYKVATLNVETGIEALSEIDTDEVVENLKEDTKEVVRDLKTTASVAGIVIEQLGEAETFEDLKDVYNNLLGNAEPEKVEELSEEDEAIAKQISGLLSPDRMFPEDKLGIDESQIADSLEKKQAIERMAKELGIDSSKDSIKIEDISKLEKELYGDKAELASVLVEKLHEVGRITDEQKFFINHASLENAGFEELETASDKNIISLELGKDRAPKHLEQVFYRAGIDSMSFGNEGITNVEAAQILNVGANLRMLSDGHDIAGVSSENFQKYVSIEGNKVTITDYEAFQDNVVSLLVDHAEEIINAENIETSGAVAYIDNIKDATWGDMLSPEGIDDSKINLNQEQIDAAEERLFQDTLNTSELGALVTNIDFEDEDSGTFMLDGQEIEVKDNQVIRIGDTKLEESISLDSKEAGDKLVDRVSDIKSREFLSSTDEAYVEENYIKVELDSTLDKLGFSKGEGRVEWEFLKDKSLDDLLNKDIKEYSDTDNEILERHRRMHMREFMQQAIDNGDIKAPTAGGQDTIEEAMKILTAQQAREKLLSDIDIAEKKVLAAEKIYSKSETLGDQAREEIAEDTKKQEINPEIITKEIKELKDNIEDYAIEDNEFESKISIIEVYKNLLHENLDVNAIDQMDIQELQNLKVKLETISETYKETPPANSELTVSDIKSLQTETKSILDKVYDRLSILTETKKAA